MSVLADAKSLTPLFYIAPVYGGQYYRIRVRAFNRVGVRSPYVELQQAYQVIGKTAAPPDCDTFSVLRHSPTTARDNSHGC